jgi:hypothetical protein
MSHGQGGQKEEGML